LGYLPETAKSRAKSFSNVAFKEIATIFKEETVAISGSAEFFRHGGDEFCAIVVNADPKAIAVAMKKVDVRVKALVKSWGLEDIPSGKPGKPGGVGIRIGTAGLEENNFDLDRIFKQADQRVEYLKEKAKKALEQLYGKRGKVPLTTTKEPGRTAELKGKDLMEHEYRVVQEDFIQHSVPKGVKPFAPPEVVDAAFNLERMRKVIPDATPADAAKLYETTKKDALGFYEASQRKPAVDRAVHDRALTTSPVFWIGAKMQNLMGINTLLGNSQANTYINRVAEIVHSTIKESGGTVYAFKSGGGITNYLTIGIDAPTLSRAMKLAEKRVHDLASQKIDPKLDVTTKTRPDNLLELPNPEEGYPPGLSLTTAIAEITPTKLPGDIMSKAEPPPPPGYVKPKPVGLPHSLAGAGGRASQR